MRKGAYIEKEDVRIFDSALTMLDNSISELRRVASHLIPEILTRYGLKTALSNFCDAIPIAQFHYYGNEKRLEQKLEITVYRVICELINNALKHAQAEHIIVQLVQEPDSIAFTIQDDGKGFDTQQISHGIGLLNIKKTIAAYNGTIDFDSKPGKGTIISGKLELN
ncbi:MAG: ATP-binding protein [Bacteroidales bacterium]|jgi:signal transduction histidine kinase|nr:ATP-binding protein [Bacteroidales bacterium]